MCVDMGGRSANGLIFDIKRFTVHDGPGIRTTVFFKGCPLNCVWCHNPESISPKQETAIRRITFDGREIERRETIGQFYSKEELIREIMKDRVFYDESDGGVTFSGGEPLMQHVFLKEAIIACREKGIHVALDTSGYASEQIFREIISLTHLVLFDIKETDEARHIKATGVSRKVIMQNLEWLAGVNIRTILRAPVIPGYTFSKDYIRSLEQLMTSIKSDNIRQIDLLPYHATAVHKYERCGFRNQMGNTKTVEKKELLPIKSELEKTGWMATIGGN